MFVENRRGMIHIDNGIQILRRKKGKCAWVGGGQ